MNRIKKVILLLGLVMVCVASLCGCKGKNLPQVSGPITDLTAVPKLFPSLNGVSDFEAEQLKWGGDDRTGVPGPEHYEYHGYIVLSEEAAAEYWDRYDFVTPSSTVSVSFEVLSDRGGNWKYSKDFADNIMDKSLTGDVWMDGNTLLFNLQTKQ